MWSCHYCKWTLMWTVWHAVCSPSSWQGHRLTLLCILDCASHLLPVPEEVETSFLNQTIKVFTKVSYNTRHVLNIFTHVCFVGITLPRLLCRWTLPQRRTSLCMQHWKQSWLPFFMSCMTKLWRRTKPPDWPCCGQPVEKKSPKRGSTFFCGHYCIKSHFLHLTLLRSASL